MNNKDERMAFVCYPTFLDAVEKMPQELQGQAALAILRLGINGEWDDSNPFIDLMLTLIAPNITAAKDRYEKACADGKKGGAPKKVDKDQVIILYREGKTREEIAREFKCSEDYVRKIIKEYEDELEEMDEEDDKEVASWEEEDRQNNPTDRQNKGGYSGNNLNKDNNKDINKEKEKDNISSADAEEAPSGAKCANAHTYETSDIIKHWNDFLIIVNRYKANPTHELTKDFKIKIASTLKEELDKNNIIDFDYIDFISFWNKSFDNFYSGKGKCFGNDLVRVIESYKINNQNNEDINKEFGIIDSSDNDDELIYEQLF